MGNLEWVAHLFATLVLHNTPIKIDLIILFPKLNLRRKQHEYKQRFV